MLKKLLEKSKLRWSLSAVLVALFAQQVPAQEIDPRIEKVIADWKKRQERTKRVRYEASGETTIFKGSHSEIRRVLGMAGATDPPRDITSPIKETMLIDFVGGRYRVEVEKQRYHLATDRLYPDVYTRLYDGKESKAWEPREVNTHPVVGLKSGGPEVSVVKGDLSVASFNWGESPFFLGHGSIMWDKGPIMPGKLRTYPDPDLLSVHGQGVDDGRTCLVLRTHTYQGSVPTFNEYWVDTQRDSAVVRQMFYAGKFAVHDNRIEYQSTDHGWLPKRWSVTDRSSANGSPTYLCKMNVDRLDLEPVSTSSDFQIEERPGMIVADYNLFPRKPGEAKAPEHEVTIYKIGEDGKRHFVSSNVPRTRHVWWYLAGGALLLILIAAWWRRRRHRRCTLACCLSVFLAAPLPAQEIDPRIAQVIADWQKRQERTERVKYEAEGEETVVKGSFRGPGRAELPEPQPSRDITTSVRQVVLLDFPAGRYRIEEERQRYHQETDRLYPHVLTRVYDGNEIRQWRPPHLNTHPVTGVKSGKPEVGVGKGDLSRAAFTTAEWPFFVGHGTVASQYALIGPGKMRIYPDPEMLVVHGQGSHAGRRCLVLRTHALNGSGTSFDEYWIDTEREGAIVRQVYYGNSVAIYEMVIEYESTRHGWLPKKWTITQRNARNGKTSYYCNMRCARLNLEAECVTDDFRIAERPGMLVAEYKHLPPRPGDSRASEIETTLFRIGDDGKRYLISSDAPARNRRWYFVAVGALAALLIVAAWCWRRRVRRLRST